MSQSLDEQQKKRVLLRVFSEDVEEFGTFFLKNHLKKQTPQFHKEIYKLFESQEKRIAIGAPRSHAKSTITDLVYLAWVIIHKKVNFVLLCSDTYSQATLFLEGLKAEFESNELLKSFYGKLTSDKWSEGEIVTNGVMIKAVGAGMKVRGLKYKEFRPDLIIVDDLENDELVMSKERREKLERWFNGALLPALDKEGKLIVIGTILHYDSLLCKLLDKEQYKEFNKRTYRAINGDKALWPEHLSITELNEIKDRYANSGQTYLFYQEYQNDPISDESRKFKLEKFKYYEPNKAFPASVQTYITIDRAYSTEQTADFTGIVVMSVDYQNNWYIRQAERFKGLESELIKKIFDLKGYYNPVKIGIEQKAFDYTLKPTLEQEMRRRNEFFMVEPLKDGGKNKNLRIEGLLPRFESGSIFFLKTHTDLIDEMITFPKAIHDDLVDALAYQLGMTEQVSTGYVFIPS